MATKAAHRYGDDEQEFMDDLIAWLTGDNPPLKGGPSSGYHDPHLGRPGQRGGSTPRYGEAGVHDDPPIDEIRKQLADRMAGGAKQRGSGEGSPKPTAKKPANLVAAMTGDAAPTQYAPKPKIAKPKAPKSKLVDATTGESAPARPTPAPTPAPVPEAEKHAATSTPEVAALLNKRAAFGASFSNLLSAYDVDDRNEVAFSMYHTINGLSTDAERIAMREGLRTGIAEYSDAITTFPSVPGWTEYKKTTKVIASGSKTEPKEYLDYLEKVTGEAITRSDLAEDERVVADVLAQVGIGAKPIDWARSAHPEAFQQALARLDVLSTGERVDGLFMKLAAGRPSLDIDMLRETATNPDMSADLSKRRGHLRTRVKEYAAEELSRRIAQERPDVPIGKSGIQQYFEKWGESTYKDMRSLGIQEVAAEVFGVELSPWQQECIGRLRGMVPDDSSPYLLPIYNEYLFEYELAEGDITAKQSETTAKDAIRAVVETTYSQTQEYLKSQGIEYMILWRGVTNIDTSQKVQIGSRVTYKDNVLSSWTTQPGTALSFSHQPDPSSLEPELRLGEGDNKGSFVLMTIVPAEKIFSLPITGPGAAGENEVVVIGNNGAGEGLVVYERRYGVAR